MAADAASRKNHHHFSLVHRQSCGNFRADEPTANDRESFALLCKFAQALVIPHRAIVNDSLVAKRKAAGSASRGQQEFIERVNIALIVLDGLPLNVDG